LGPIWPFLRLGLGLEGPSLGLGLAV